jgi:hypothetical protein
MSNVVEFPTPEPVEIEWTQSMIDEVHGRAFRNLESDVCDLERMGQIAQDLIVQCVDRGDGEREIELSSFAVVELVKMLRTFKDRYYKHWYGEPVGPS